MISWQSAGELRRIDSLTESISESLELERLYESSKESKGYLSLLSEGYQKSDNPYDKDVRFWIASTIETFLRGNNPYFQLFFARTGAFQTVVNQILELGPNEGNLLQIAFDLASESIKFNKRVLKIFEIEVKGKAE